MAQERSNNVNVKGRNLNVYNNGTCISGGEAKLGKKGAGNVAAKSLMVDEQQVAVIQSRPYVQKSVPRKKTLALKNSDPLPMVRQLPPQGPGESSASDNDNKGEHSPLTLAANVSKAVLIQSKLLPKLLVGKQKNGKSTEEACESDALVMASRDASVDGGPRQGGWMVDVWTDLHRTFGNFSPQQLFTGAICGTAPWNDVTRDDTLAENTTTTCSMPAWLVQSPNDDLMIKNPTFNSTESDIISVTFMKPDSKLSNSAGESARGSKDQTSFECRTEEEDRGGRDKCDTAKVSREDIGKDNSQEISENLDREAVDSSGASQADRILQISVDRGIGKGVENITINMDSAHFCGWDGMRSHYTLAVVPCTTAEPSDLVISGLHPRGHHQKGIITMGRRISKTQGAAEHVNVDTTKLRLLSPYLHPLKECASDPNDEQTQVSKIDDVNKLASRSPVVHIIQQAPHVHNHSNIGIDSSSSSWSDTADIDGSFTSKGSDFSQLSDNIFTLLKKLAFAKNTEKRKHKPRKDANNIDEILDPRKLPMGDDEREIILGFLGSSSYSGSRSRGRDDRSATTDPKKPAANADITSVCPVESVPSSSIKTYGPPAVSYIFEEGNGTIYLKAAEQWEKRSSKSQKFLSSVISKRQHASDRFPRHGTVLKPGWRLIAAKEIQRGKSRTLDAKKGSLQANGKLRAASASFGGMGKERWMKSSEGGASRDQSESLYFNLFGTAAAHVGVEREDDEAAPSNNDDCIHGTLVIPYLKKCAPSFDSLLRRRHTGWPRRRCLFEGWMAFRVGGAHDVPTSWKDAQRDWLRYVVIHESSHVLFAYDSVDASAASKSIDLSRGRIAEPLLISRELGYAVIIKSKTTDKILCTILPVFLSDAVFTDSGYWKVAEQPQFAKIWKQTYAKQKSKWGDPGCLAGFASPGQHFAFLHLFYTINTVIGKYQVD